MTHVSVSVYDDADLLAACLQSVRDHLPDATVQVVDGRYASWPAEADNSTDDTAFVADTHGAEYVAGGPYPDERAKHLHRVDLAPDGERTILLDADERLVTADVAALDDRAYRPRIHNPLVYSQNEVVYWPRIFQPEWVAAIDRWDAYRFAIDGVDPGDVCRRTDAVTIAHRHDLRDRAYREAKVQRFHNEGRTSRYEGGGQDLRPDRLQQYYDADFPIETERCPDCGGDSLAVSPATIAAPDGPLTRVRTCVNGECHASVESIAVGDYRYVPDAISRGFEEDPGRLRVELLHSGACRWVPEDCPPPQFRSLRPVVERWAAGDGAAETL